MSGPVLRPRSIAELIDAAAQLLKRHYLQFVSIAAVFLIPVILIDAFLGASAVGITPGASPREIIWRPFLAAAPSGFLALLGSAAMVVGVSDSYVRDRVDVGQAVGRVLARMFPIIRGALLQMFVFFVGAIAVTFAVFTTMTALIAVIPFSAARAVVALGSGVLALLGILIIGARIFAVPMIVVLERLSPSAALRRSFQLTRDDVWRVAGVLVITGIIFLAIYALLLLLILGGVHGLAGASEGSPVIQVLGHVLNIFAYPIYTVFLTLMYYDLRIRREGFDLELMARELQVTGKS